MKHLVIVPAYNEEDNIHRVVESIAAQTVLPSRMVIVDDGSTDNTPRLLDKYALQYPWLNIVTNTKKDPRATGAKIVRAFNLGLDSEQLDDFDIVSKFDADLEFPPHYFQELEKVFTDKTIGLAGGVCTIFENEKWKEEKVSKADHIRGALKSYRVAAFKQMGGLQLFMGWDSADEFILRYHNWKIKRRDDLHVKHFRETNELNGWIKTSKLNAKVFHNLDYGFLIGSLSALKRGVVNSPFILSGLVTFYFFIAGYFSREARKLDPEIGKFIRTYRRNSIFNK